MGATTTTPAFPAASERASVVGPGTGSARSNVAASSRWQKYWERKSSGRQTTSAPFRAASSTRSTALARFASESAEQDICTSATRKFSDIAGETTERSTGSQGADLDPLLCHSEERSDEESAPVRPPPSRRKDSERRSAQVAR